MPESIRHSSEKISMFRASQSLGSITTLFSTPQKRRMEGIPKPMPRTSKIISKSEETLDSLKRSFSDTEESPTEDSDSDTSEDIVRKYTN